MWEKENGREFLVDGVRFIQYIDEQWKAYQESKIKEKEERVCWKNKFIGCCVGIKTLSSCLLLYPVKFMYHYYNIFCYCP